MGRGAKEPLVTIVTPVRNGADFFAATFETVQAQTYKNWEWIVVDDGSTDDTVNIIKGFGSKKIRVISLEKNGGAAKARNKGIKEAEGKFLCFLDADDLWDKEKLAKQVRFMQEKECAFSFTGYEFADAAGKPNGKVVLVPTTISYEQALKNTTIWTSTVMLDMQKLSKEDVLMPNIASEDTATWWKILKKVDLAYGLNETLSIYRRSGKTLSSNKLVAIHRIWNLYRRQEGLGLVESAMNFAGYAVNAVKRRM